MSDHDNLNERTAMTVDEALKFADKAGGGSTFWPAVLAREVRRLREKNGAYQEITFKVLDNAREEGRREERGAMEVQLCSLIGPADSVFTERRKVIGEMLKMLRARAEEGGDDRR